MVVWEKYERKEGKELASEKLRDSEYKEKYGRKVEEIF